MRENFIFENHLGLRFVGAENGVFLNTNELRDYSWSYDVINNRISRFFRSVTTRKIPLMVCCSSVEEANDARNRILDLAEADVVAMLPGKVYLNGYYTTGYVTASKKTDYRMHGRYCLIELSLTSASPAWNRETLHVFGGDQQGAAQDRSGFDFPFDYKFDYSVTTTSRQIINDTIKASNFKLKIYGEATNPAIMINGHVYEVVGMVKPGESLEINSLDKTIVLKTAAGTTINWFNNRGRNNYIFEPIPAGANNVMFNGSFKFDLTIIEERSEPKWI